MAREHLVACGALGRGAPEANWEALVKSMGAEFVEDLLVAFDRRHRDHTDDAVYALLYRDSETIRACLSLLTPMASAWLAKAPGLGLPDSVLDLGCGAGVVTCFYARLDPHRHVVGVDANPVATKFASDLAERLGLTNVSFVTSSVEDLDLGQSFETVVSLAAFAEIDGSVQMSAGGFSWYQRVVRGDLAMDSRLAGCAERHRTADGTYLSVERIGHPSAIARFVQSLGRVGLHLDLASRDVLTFRDAWQSRDDQRVPILKASRQVPPVTGDELFRELAKWSAMSAEDFPVELALDGEVRFIDGVHAEVRDHLGEGQTRIYLLATAKGQLCYLTNSRGLREIPGRGSEAKKAFAGWQARLARATDVVSTRRLAPEELADILPRI